MLRNKDYTAYYLPELRINTREKEREVGRNNGSAKTRQMFPIHNGRMCMFTML